eukprot:6191197-Pleurochrysis_carterae.AAC.2
MSTSGCVQFAEMPSLPRGTVSDPALYGASEGAWRNSVETARTIIRSSNFSWMLSADADTRFARAQEVRASTHLVQH